MIVDYTEAYQVLSKYGLIKTCKLVHPDVFTLVITDGFKPSTQTTINFINDCYELFPEHVNIKTIITNIDFAMLVLTKNL